MIYWFLPSVARWRDWLRKLRDGGILWTERSFWWGRSRRGMRRLVILTYSEYPIIIFARLLLGQGREGWAKNRWAQETEGWGVQAQLQDSSGGDKGAVNAKDGPGLQNSENQEETCHSRVLRVRNKQRKVNSLQRDYLQYNTPSHSAPLSLDW